MTVAVLHERGLSTEGETPTLLTRDGVVAADLVVTTGCGEACPRVPGRRVGDGELDDPDGQDLATVRRTVDEVDLRVRGLLAELGVPGEPSPGTADPASPGQKLPIPQEILDYARQHRLRIVQTP